MSDGEGLVLLGRVENQAGDTVVVGLQAGKVYVESANEGREPVEVWLSPAEAAGLADLLRRGASSGGS